MCVRLVERRRKASSFVAWLCRLTAKAPLNLRLPSSRRSSRGVLRSIYQQQHQDTSIGVQELASKMVIYHHYHYKDNTKNCTNTRFLPPSREESSFFFGFFAMPDGNYSTDMTSSFLLVYDFRSSSPRNFCPLLLSPACDCLIIVIIMSRLKVCLLLVSYYPHISNKTKETGLLTEFPL